VPAIAAHSTTTAAVAVVCFVVRGRIGIPVLISVRSVDIRGVIFVDDLPELIVQATS
jgi:expansin (peptidoglycan-binding protein)